VPVYRSGALLAWTATAAAIAAWRATRHNWSSVTVYLHAAKPTTAVIR
jgi:hypothetical protein